MTTVYKWSHKGEMCEMWKAQTPHVPSHAAALNEEMVVRIRGRFSLSGAIHVILWMKSTRRYNGHKGAWTPHSVTCTHRQGDTEVIGDVLERQHRHWPQVTSPLQEKSPHRFHKTTRQWSQIQTTQKKIALTTGSHLYLCWWTLSPVELCLGVVGTQTSLGSATLSDPHTVGRPAKNGLLINL